MLSDFSTLSLTPRESIAAPRQHINTKRWTPPLSSEDPTMGKQRLKKTLGITCLITIVFGLVPHSIYGWNNTGHMLVARIAWENLDPDVRSKVIELLMQAPEDACLRQLFPNDSRPLEVRQRQFFISAATWPDIVRPRDDSDHRVCTKYHRSQWHFDDHFWSGISGDPNNPPKDVSTIPLAEVNAAERIKIFRDAITSNLPAPDRAMKLAWILHLVGDIHQPLHTSGHVTSLASEKNGDRGGNTFKLGFGDNAPKLHSYWDGIVDRGAPRKSNETFSKYIERLNTGFQTQFPKTTFTSTLKPGQIDEWVIESLTLAKENAYPRTLKRNHFPKPAYQDRCFDVSSESISKAGYRLAELLNHAFGS